MEVSKPIRRCMSSEQVFEKLFESNEVILIHLAIVFRNDPPSLATKQCQILEIRSIYRDLRSEKEAILEEREGFFRWQLALKALRVCCVRFEINPLLVHLNNHIRVPVDPAPKLPLITAPPAPLVPILRPEISKLEEESDSDSSTSDLDEGPLLAEIPYRSRPGLNPVDGFSAALISEQEKLAIYKQEVDLIAKEEGKVAGEQSLNSIIQNSLITGALAAITGNDNERLMLALISDKLEQLIEIYKGYELAPPSNISNYLSQIHFHMVNREEYLDLLGSDIKSAYNLLHILRKLQGIVFYYQHVKADQIKMIQQLDKFVEIIVEFDFKGEISKHDDGDDCEFTQILREFHVAKFVLEEIVEIYEDLKIELPVIIREKLSQFPCWMKESYNMLNVEALATIPDVQILDMCDDEEIIVNNVSAIRQIGKMVNLLFESLRGSPIEMMGQLCHVVTKSCYNRAKYDIEKTFGGAANFENLEKKYDACRLSFGTSQLSKAVQALLST